MNLRGRSLLKETGPEDSQLDRLHTIKAVMVATAGDVV